MATRKPAAKIEVDPQLRDPAKSKELFQQAKKLYLGMEQQTPSDLEEVIKMFELSTVLDPANKDAQAYLNYAQRDLNGLQKKKKQSSSSTRSRSKAEPKDEASLTAAYDTDEENTIDEDKELYGEDDEEEAPPWNALPSEDGEEDHSWESR